MDQRTGRILGSGPIFGPLSKPFDLAGRVAREIKNIQVSVVNDLTALLFGGQLEETLNPIARKKMVITVSTGIGARTIDCRTGVIPSDRITGLQGEIGHVPVTLEAFGKTWTRQCDCGGQDHLNAFCSGRGIERLSGELDPLRSSLLDQPNRTTLFRHWKARLDAGDPVWGEFLSSVLRPLTRIILLLLTADPELDRISIVGGVVSALQPHYEKTFRALCSLEGPYLNSDPESYFRDVLRFPIDNSEDCLRGAYLSQSSAAQQITH